METIKHCFKCRGTQIVRGVLTTDAGASFTVVFKPPGVRPLKFTDKSGIEIPPDSYACLDCGAVWSQTDAAALSRFIADKCKNEKADASYEG